MLISGKPLKKCRWLHKQGIAQFGLCFPAADFPVGTLPEAQSRPYIILEDISYYSNAALQTGIVSDLVDQAAGCDLL